MLPILRPLVHVIANRMMLLRTGNASYMVVLAIIVIIITIVIIIIITIIVTIIMMMMQECEDPSYVAVLASHTAHRAANKAVASNTVTIGNFEREKEEEVEDGAGGRSKSATRAFNACEQASEFLEAAVRFLSISSFIILFTTFFWSFGCHAYRIVNKESIRFTFGTRTMIRSLSCLIGFLSCFE